MLFILGLERNFTCTPPFYRNGNQKQNERNNPCCRENKEILTISHSEITNAVTFYTFFHSYTQLNRNKNNCLHLWSRSASVLNVVSNIPFLREKQQVRHTLRPTLNNHKPLSKNHLTRGLKCWLNYLNKKNYIKTVHSSCYSFIYESVQHILAKHPKLKTSSKSPHNRHQTQRSKFCFCLLPTILQSVLLLVLPLFSDSKQRK